MALDVSALTAYSDEISSGLAKQIVLTANTLKGDLVSMKFGVFGDTFKLNFVKSTMLGTNALCNNTDAGSTIMAQGIINMCPITFPQSICLDILKGFYNDYEMERVYNPETLGTFQEVFATNKMETIAKELDKIIWQGNKSTGSANLALCDGFLATAVALTGEITVAITAMTPSNAVAYVDTILGAVPAEILDNVELYLSPSDFQKYLAGLRALNLFNYQTGSEGVHSILHPGSIGMNVHSVNGLAGAPSGTFIATAKENIVLAFGGNDDMSFDMWYSQDLQALKINSKTKLGTGFYFPELVVRSI
jgi:hypothetical protein